MKWKHCCAIILKTCIFKASTEFTEYIPEDIKMFDPIFESKTGETFSFGRHLRVSANHCLNSEHIKSFWKGFCCQACELEMLPCDELIFSAGEARKPSLGGNRYAVNIEKSGFCIAGDSRKSLINGYMTLLHQIRAVEISDNNTVFEIDCGEFKESPRIENQMVHFCIFPETELWELEKFIRLSAALKFSHIVLEFWGMLRYDCLGELAWSHAYSKEQIRPLIEMANALGLEVIPMFNHLGHASASRMIHGKHVVLDQNPALQPLFSEDGWTWNIRNPDTLKLLRSVREELIELCGEGKYFHLGCDEAYNFEITEENHTVLTDYLNGISAELASLGRRAIVWGDMLAAKRDSFNPCNRYTATCESAELEKCILSDLSRSIIIADWQYGVKEDPVETSLIFKDAGFDTLICPWDRTFGGSSVAPCVNTAVKNGLFGVLHTTWNTLSVGMSDVAKTAYRAWDMRGKADKLSDSFYATHTAKILRKIYFVSGCYKKAGWAKNQIPDIAK